MPVQMRHDVAKTGEVDLIGLHRGAHGTFDGIQHIEQVPPLAGCQIGQLRDMRLPDNPAEAGKSSTLAAADADDAANLILPQKLTAKRSA